MQNFETPLFVDSLPDKKAFARAITSVERLLKIRLRSEHELRTRLEAKNFSENIIDAVIHKYSEIGIVNDCFFSEQWIKSRQRKSYGQKRIRYELILKGVDKNIIDDNLTSAWRKFNEQKVITELSQKWSEKHKKTLNKEKMKQRLYAHLSRRGFSSTAIFNALKNHER